MSRPRYVVRMSLRALQHLEDVGDRIAIDNPENARDFIRELLEHIQSLSEYPLRCPPAQEGTRRGRQLRQLVVGSYRIVFSVREKVVMVYSVKHGARRVE